MDRLPDHRLHPISEVICELKRWIGSGEEADYITLSGSGEPTLHTGFGRVLKFVKENSNIPTALLTNATLLNQADVREAACLANVVKVTLSAFNQVSYEWVNRPHPSLRFEQLIEGQKALREQFQGELWLEVFLVNGINSTSTAVEKMAAIAAEIRPDRIHLNTAVRPPVEDFAASVPQERLASLADIFRPRAEVIAHFKGATPGRRQAFQPSRDLCHVKASALHGRRHRRRLWPACHRGTEASRSFVAGKACPGNPQSQRRLLRRPIGVTVKKGYAMNGWMGSILKVEWFQEVGKEQFGNEGAAIPDSYDGKAMSAIISEHNNVPRVSLENPMEGGAEMAKFMVVHRDPDILWSEVEENWAKLAEIETQGGYGLTSTERKG